MPVSLQHLQKHLPWSIAYTNSFIDSNRIEGHRAVIHDLLHVQKSIGRIAAMCEDRDHGREDTDTNDARLRLVADFQKSIADLVICALHMSKANPWHAIDLGAAVVQRLEEKNKVKIPPEDHVAPAIDSLIDQGIEQLRSILKGKAP